MKWEMFDKYTFIEEKHRAYIEEYTEYCKKGTRIPKYHIIPPCGLMNDPNGLAYYNGKYHIFFQWHPFGPSHGMKHWGQVTTEDFITWQYEKEILIPNQEYEKNGCYSGNAMQMGDDLYLYYTANYKTDQGKVPKQALACLHKDGTIEKYEKNPIIDEQPEGLIGEIRDPFVFERNGSYYMLLGGGTTKGQGKILQYKSEDALSWQYDGCIEVEGLDFGWMLECPGIIEVDGKDVLFVSVMGMEAQGERYHNEFTTLYYAGSYDEKKKVFHTECWDELDKGFDFYAPQAFYDKEKQPIYFGWFGCGVQELPYMEKDMWIHGLTMPRKLEIRDGKLYQILLPQVKEQFTELAMEKDTMIPEETQFLLTIDHYKTPYSSIQIGTDDDCLKIMIDQEHGKLSVDRQGLKQQFSTKYGTDRSLVFAPGAFEKMEIYYDNTFVEISINDGAEWMSLRAFPETLCVTCK